MDNSLTDGPWTHFHDMHSGGSCKVEPYGHIFIQAPLREAESVFYAKFGRNPNKVTCTCCGEDYSVSETTDLYQVTAYQRGCEWEDSSRKYIENQGGKFQFNGYRPLEDYLTEPTVKFIFASEISQDERSREIPRSGYIWVGDD